MTFWHVPVTALREQSRQQYHGVYNASCYISAKFEAQTRQVQGLRIPKPTAESAAEPAGPGGPWNLTFWHVPVRALHGQSRRQYRSVGNRSCYLGSKEASLHRLV